MQADSIRVGLVQPGKRLRPLSPTAVDQIAESIRYSGLLQPIIVTPDGDLIDGYHRLEAFKKLGRTEIPCIFREATAAENELAEIDANLCRNELTALERSEHLARREEIYNAAKASKQPGVKGLAAESLACETRACAVPNESARMQSSVGSFDPDEGATFAEDTARRTGMAKSTIYNQLAPAKRLSSAVRDKVRSTPIADSARELAALAAIPADKQEATIEEALAAGVTVQALTAAPKKARRSDATRILMARAALKDCCPACAARLRPFLA